jgi:hypothetical protein
VTVGPFFKWFGSKWTAAKTNRYPKPLEGLPVVEPYAGSAGYACAHHEAPVVLFDADPNVTELWRWLIAASRDDILDIPLNLPPKTDIRGLGLSRGQALLLKNWQRTNNVSETWHTSPWGHMPGQWTSSTRARVADQIGALKHWRVATAESVWDAGPATWFIDPPYQYNYQYRSGLFHGYDTLVERVGKLQGLVICCEAVGPKGEIPTYLPFAASHTQVTSRRTKTASRELVYIRR